MVFDLCQTWLKYRVEAKCSLELARGVKAVIAVRRATVSDATDMGRIYVETWQDAYAGLLRDGGLLSMSAKRRTSRMEAMICDLSSKDVCLVATHETYGVIGMASAGPTRTRDLPFGAEVFTLYVDPNHQRLGAGRALLSGLFSAMHQAGQRSLVIWALGGNPARTFYERLGGTEVARREGITFGDSHEEVAFGWPTMSLGDEARVEET